MTATAAQIALDARFSAALRGEVEGAAVRIDYVREYGLLCARYSVSLPVEDGFESGAWAGGTCSVPALVRWMEEGRSGADPEMEEALARVGLEDSADGPLLMDDWTWAEHEAAVGLVTRP